MKFLKKLATFCMALTMCFGLGTALVACGDEGAQSSSSSQTATTQYSFVVVKEDQSPALGYEIQLCKINADGTQGSCLAPVPVTADGSVKVTIADTSIGYEIHVTKDSVPLDKDKYSVTGDIPANHDASQGFIVLVYD